MTMSNRIRTTRCAPKGVALLMVLAMIMVITVLSLGFLARSSTELASGQNMGLRMQMDQTAVSGLEHARGLILNRPQGVSGGYWAGATAQQLDASSNDFYDVNIVADAIDRCNYNITCEAYRLEGGQRVGRSRLAAQLRLDPCVALWLGTATALPEGVTVQGDTYCGGNLANNGTLAGDVFTAGAMTGSNPTGRVNAPVAQTPIPWPDLTVSRYDPSYQVGDTTHSPASVGTYEHPSGSFTPYTGNPAGVRLRSGDAKLAGNVDITGLFVVDGHLRVSGVNNVITAVSDHPAVLVNNDLIIEPGGALTVNGLAVVKGRTKISADQGVLNVVGGWFTSNDLVETTEDASGNGLTGCVYGAATWNPSGGRNNGTLQFDGVDDYVDCSDDASFAILDRITVAAWVRTQDAGNGEHNPWVTKGNRAYALKHNADSNIEFFIYDPIGAWKSVKYPVGSAFNNQWHHVAGTYDGNDIKLYIDGVLEVTNPHVGTINNQNFPVNIGHNADEADRFYQGAMDEVRIYGRALDATEILQLFGSPHLAGDTTDLRARYRFDEAGSVVTITADPASAKVFMWDWDGAIAVWLGQCWGQAGGAFYKTVYRD